MSQLDLSMFFDNIFLCFLFLMILFILVNFMFLKLLFINKFSGLNNDYGDLYNKKYLNKFGGVLSKMVIN